MDLTRFLYFLLLVGWLTIDVCLIWALLGFPSVANWSKYDPPCYGCGERHAYGPCPTQPKD